jgi:tRNA A-37 threonylcarbamoyl transferase component Bud32
MGVQTDILPPRYRDVELIGRGGMGEIYRARDETLGRTVAVKLLADRYSADEEVRGRFTREALAAARLSGEPSVVTIFDVGEWNGRPFIVMEHLDGGSLAEALSRGPVPPERALAWLDEAARALDAAHAQGVVHRDVKPGNLLLDRKGDVHVADFGVASAAGLDSLTQTGTVLGTAGYLAPEQARGEQTTPASDRYAFAVVAYELLSGRRPFESDSPTAEALGHVQAPIPAISAVNRELPGELDDVFRRALAKEPDARYATAEQFVGALRDAFAAAAGTTARRTAVAAAPTAVATARREDALAAPRPARGRRSLLPLALLALLAIGIAGAALAALVTRDDGETAREAPRTIERTITEEGETATVTATVEQPPAPPSPEPPAASPPPAASGAELNNQGFALMQEGRYEEALPLLEQAVAKLAGTGELAEAYALYNLAFTRLQLGNCDGVLAMLDRSEDIQGHRVEIDRTRREAEQRCGEGDSGPGGGDGDD